MRVEFDVTMTTMKMYDYMLYHTFHGVQGILGPMVGLLLMAGYFLTDPHQILYLICGIVVICYLPFVLFISAKRQVSMSPIYRQPLHYILSEEGIEVHVGGETDSLPWENMRKAVSTGKNIILYTSKSTASLFPRADLKDQETAVIEIISKYMEPKKVNIRI